MAVLTSPTTIVASFAATNRRVVLDAVAATQSRFGPTDAIANNADIMLLGEITRQAPEEWARMSDVNVCGLLNCVLAVAGAMSSVDAALSSTSAPSPTGSVFRSLLPMSATSLPSLAYPRISAKSSPPVTSE